MAKERMKPRVAVLFGGVSVEHEVSVISGVQVFHAIDTEKFDAFPVYISKSGRWYTGDKLSDVSNYSNLPVLLSACTEVCPRPIRGDWNLYPLTTSPFSFQGILGSPATSGIPVDVYFPVFHGSFGEDGSIQGLLQMMDVPFVGCDTTSAAVSMDKVVMKEVLKGLSLPVVDSCWFTRQEAEEDLPGVTQRVIESCGFPCILKPALLGSSVGIEIVKDESDFSLAVSRVSSYCPKILVEQFLSEMFEINCSVIGNETFQRASVLERPLSSGELLSFADKYERSGGKKGGGSSMAAMDRIIPADISEERTVRIQGLAKQVFKGLGCSGVSRIDFMVEDAADKIYVNELNSIPGSLSFYLWDKTDLPFSELLNELIRIALVRYREREATVYSYETNLFSLHSKGGGAKSGTKTP